MTRYSDLAFKPGPGVFVPANALTLAPLPEPPTELKLGAGRVERRVWTTIAVIGVMLLLTCLVSLVASFFTNPGLFIVFSPTASGVAFLLAARRNLVTVYRPALQTMRERLEEPLPEREIITAASNPFTKMLEQAMEPKRAPLTEYLKKNPGRVTPETAKLLENDPGPFPWPDATQAETWDPVMSAVKSLGNNGTKIIASQQPLHIAEFMAQMQRMAREAARLSTDEYQPPLRQLSEAYGDVREAYLQAVAQKQSKDAKALVDRLPTLQHLLEQYVGSAFRPRPPAKRETRSSGGFAAPSLIVYDTENFSVQRKTQA